MNLNRLTPFKWFVLQNFPFIEEDFDAITNWQLFCKLGDELNKTIDNVNIIGTQVENLTTYVNDFFDNLDVQDEIDTKLDEMVTDGTMAEIINQEIFGELNQKVDNNYNTLDGKIDENYNTLDGKIEQNKEDIERLQSKKILFIGDSYLTLNNGTTGIIDKFKTISNINNVIYSIKSGVGFDYTVDTENFVTLLQDVTDDEEVTDIICVGGYNDQYSNQSDVDTAIGTFCATALTKFPNAKVYIGMIGFTMEYAKRYPIFNVFQTYSNCNKHGAIYLSGVENVMHNLDYFVGGLDLTHPNETGRLNLARAIYQSWLGGNFNYNYGFHTLPTSIAGDVTSGSLSLSAMIINNMTYIVHQSNSTLYFATNPSYSDIHDLSIKIGELNLSSNHKIVSPWPYNMYPIPVTCIIHDQHGYRTMNGKLHFINNDIELSIEDAEQNNWTDIDDLESIEINDFCAVFPTAMI